MFSQNQSQFLTTDVTSNIFRLVELGKLENKSRGAEKRQFQMDPQVRKIKNKAGVVEMRTVCCAECGEDFCNGKSHITQLIRVHFNIGIT